MSDIEALLRSSNATRKILMLDACHTGVEMGRDIADPNFIRNVCEQAQGFALLVASTAQQKAFELGKMQHGVFSYFVLKGLSGAAEQVSRQIVTFDDLKGYVLNEIRDWNKTVGGFVQEPTYKSEGIGDMILVDYREQAKPDWNEADRQDADSSSGRRASSESVTLSQADQEMIESLQKQRQGIKKQMDAVTAALLGADVDEEVRLEAKRDRLSSKLSKIDQRLKELGNVL
ncbi:MAG: hypothetical protein AAGG51_24520 [Cyanobacteria bacterium P01_G01_bin.54]